MRYYLIRHKGTKLFMPQAKRDRGYSHWNPAADKKYTDGGMEAALRVPRLIESRRQAEQCIIQWAINPNARYHQRQTYYGEYDDDIVTKDDGRKREDLEVVEVDITEVQNEQGEGASTSVETNNIR